MGRRALMLAVVIVMLTIAWHLLSRSFGSERFPNPGTTASIFWRSAFQDSLIEAQGGGSKGFWPHFLFTSRNSLTGVCGGSSIGLILALIVFQWRKAAAFMDSLVEIIRVLPPLILAPFAAVMLNSSAAMESFTVGLYSALSIALYALSSLATIPSEYLAISKLFGTSSLRRAFTVQLPAILPGMVGPLAVNAALGTGICIVVEFLAAPAGIGRVIKFALSFYRVDLIFVGIAWAAVCVFITDSIIIFILWRALRWR
jgi:NitT/TauT family transport system permease protein